VKQDGSWSASVAAGGISGVSGSGDMFPRYVSYLGDMLAHLYYGIGNHIVEEMILRESTVFDPAGHPAHAWPGPEFWQHVWRNVYT
jgi:hypothetical protein